MLYINILALSLWACLRADFRFVFRQKAKANFCLASFFRIWPLDCYSCVYSTQRTNYTDVSCKLASDGSTDSLCGSVPVCLCSAQPLTELSSLQFSHLFPLAICAVICVIFILKVKHLKLVFKLLKICILPLTMYAITPRVWTHMLF